MSYDLDKLINEIECGDGDLPWPVREQLAEALKDLQGRLGPETKDDQFFRAWPDHQLAGGPRVEEQDMSYDLDRLIKTYSDSPKFCGDKELQIALRDLRKIFLACLSLGAFPIRGHSVDLETLAANEKARQDP